MLLHQAREVNGDCSPGESAQMGGGQWKLWKQSGGNLGGGARPGRVGNSGLEVSLRSCLGQARRMERCRKCIGALRAPADIRVSHLLAGGPRRQAGGAVVGSSPRRDYPPPGCKVGCQPSRGMPCNETSGQPKKNKGKIQNGGSRSIVLDPENSLQLPPHLLHQGKREGLLNLKRPRLPRLRPPRHGTCCPLKDLVQQCASRGA